MQKPPKLRQILLQLLQVLLKCRQCNQAQQQEPKHQQKWMILVSSKRPRFQSYWFDYSKIGILALAAIA